MVRQRRRTGCVSFVFFAILAVVAGIAFAVWRGVGPLPDPEGCSASVDGHDLSLASDQADNATLIAAIGVRRGLPARAVSIALATAYQESKIRNLTSGDRDSVGLFQQRPSQGWGTVQQILDRTYAINRFYDALQKVPGYQTMRITEAAQLVQRSGYPEAYEGHAADARALASAITGYSPAAFTCVVHDRTSRGTARALIASVDDAFGSVGLERTGSRQDVRMPAAGTAGNQRGWAVADYLLGHAGELGVREITFDGHIWKIGRTSEKGWVADPAASSDELLVSLG